ncbi:endonuclease/exonuclease/phosphatase (EEP) superfamily protein YafD [Gelidibacter algens]|uniref:Endonuclease/exonuclease/phosphatase (EEP) superfamily protein YafD n=1 Tax=Gelidibacter algens TaxID=49280 RepID=A0A1A7R6I4_9FLAO|nr:endonuclease/exonuclease/phosphatase family protein [Gelidibacter algens]OBX27103.1 endonuclease [Gelidibacter algens]RAJ27938.1 endonuclease/exonuclease/phosphatase (EEP) superfamily protein YafD [Gelidibacter algens]
MLLKKILFGFGIIAIIFTLIPLIPTDYWWIRMFDFPHIQLTTLTFIAIVVYCIKFDFKNIKDYAFILMLIACFIYQFYKIVPYTPFHEKEVMAATVTNTIPKIKLLTANVLQKNENNDHLIDLIKELDADIMVFTEANKRWKDAIVQNLTSDYKYKLELPLENTYGILMYSKLELINPEVKFLVTDSIPSIHSKVRLPSGDVIQLYAIHPTPPMPQENPLSTDRDAELMMTSALARESEVPVIVIGDFNDIPWSSTSKLFQATSELLDIRVGRGFFSTFNAQKYLFRWPLDHVYVSPEFRLLHMKSCESIDSDHFPYYVELTFEPDGAKEQLPEPATKDQLEKAQKQLAKLKTKNES